MSRITRISIICLGALLFLACSVGPRYQAPDLKAPDSWSSASEDMKVSAESPIESNWWTWLDDPLLNELVNQGLAQNLDLAQAKARLAESRALWRSSRAELLPKVGLGASGGLSQPAQSVEPTASASVGLDASWEVDLFGAQDQAVQAALADLQSAESQIRGARLSVLTEICLVYVQLRTGQQRLAVARENLQFLQQAEALARMRQQAGMDTELAVLQARSSVSSARASLPSLQVACTESIHRLAVLLAEDTGKLKARLGRPGPIPETPESLHLTPPAEALRRRPDVVQAELAVVARFAKLKQAHAARYPSLSLHGSIGMSAVSGQALSLANLLSQVLASLTWPLFDGGAIEQAIAQEQARLDQSLLSYRITVLEAVEEAENAIDGWQAEHLRENDLDEASATAAETAKLAMFQYESGLVDFSEVLNAQRSLLQARDEQASSRGLLSLGFIKVIKSMGGGWHATEK